jgi:predicted dehydrogenase
LSDSITRNPECAVSDEISRRSFVSTSSKLAMGAMIVPRRVLGGPGYQAPSDTLNVAIVGAGGMGGENAQQLGSENIVAVCDLDHALVARKVQERMTDGDGNPREKGHRWAEQYERATKYTRFDEMLERQTDIDAVVIATPDHTHAVIAAACMKEGKHVYVQKPLTWSVHEARALARLAEETGVVTQMGNQGHSSDEARLINEWVQAGVIGTVRDVHVWTDRPIWAQGYPRPKPMDADFDPHDPDRSWWPGSVAQYAAAGLHDDFSPPDGFDWDLYLGPCARDVPYHPIYHPFHWRGWVDFGVGALGDMGAHLIDHPYWALDLGYPTTIEATSTPWGGDSDDPDSYPVSTSVHYEFPRRGLMPPADLYWYDGGIMPRRPLELPADVELERMGGVIYVGERGVLMHETYGDNPQLFPQALHEEAATVPQTYTRIEDGHEMNWANACKGEAEATSPFSYAAPLTEVMLLGLVALRAGQGFKMTYDADAMRVTNSQEANRFLTREYRDGWSL